MSRKTWLRSALAALALVVTGPALASSVGNVTQVPTVAWVTGHDLSRTPNIRLAGFANDKDGGGGQFTLATCAGAVHDGGVVLVDSVGNCFFRSFTGPVNIAWYGVTPATNSSCIPPGGSMATCDARTALTAAFTASAAFGDGGVTTAGRSIAITSGNVTIPTGQYLTCQGPPGGMRNQGSGDYYWELNNSIVLDPAYTIGQTKQTDLHHCFIRPSWLVPGWIPEINPDLADVVAGRRLFSGTAVTAVGEASGFHHNTVLGFDVCHDASDSPRTVIHDNIYECNIQEYIHAQGGGIKLQNLNSKSILFGQLQNGCRNPPTCSVTGAIQLGRWPITTVANSAGEVQVTISSGGLFMNNVIEAGWKVLINGLGVRSLVDVKPPGTVTNSDSTLTNVGLESTGAIDVTAGFIRIGDAAFDDTGSCIPANTYVTDVTLAETGIATVELTNNATCSGSFSDLRFTGVGVSPPSANGMWTVKSVVGDNIILLGSSWTGPTYTATWKEGATGVVVYDTTNIRVNQYFCASGTAPFCTPPTGFTFSTTTATSGLTALGASGVGFVFVGDTTNWPRDGLVQIGTEYLTYRIANQQKINIRARAQGGTTGASHTDGDTITAAAPTVRAVLPTPRSDVSNFVVLSSVAQADGSGTVVFTNFTTVSGTYIGELAVIPSYQYWARQNDGGPVPSDVLTATGSASSGSTTLTLTANGHKVFPGQTVTNVTTPGDITAGTTVASVSGNVVTLSVVTAGLISSEKIFFSGCGWPGITTGTTADDEPWLGNCSGTAFLLGGSNAVEGQGITTEWLHSNSDRVGIHVLNSPNTTLTDNIMASGGNSGSQRDISAISLWIDGNSDIVAVTSGAYKGKLTCILNTSSKNNDGVGLSNIHCAVNGGVLLANMGLGTNTHVEGLHGDDPAVIFADATQGRMVLTGNDYPNVDVQFDDEVALTTIHCANNLFLSDSLCASPAVGITGDDIATVDTIAEFQAGDFDRADTVIVRGYHAVNDGGGGIFNIIGAGTDDDGVTICTTGQRCFKRQNITGDVREFGAYCDMNVFAAIGTTTAASTTITTGAHQAASTAVGLPIVLPTSGAAPFYPQNTVTVTAAGSGYTVGETLTDNAGTGTASVRFVLTVASLTGVTGPCPSGDCIASVRWANKAAYGVYTVVPTNPVGTTASAAGTGATFTVKWTGAPLVTTVASVGTNTIVLAAAPGVTQNTIPLWAYGHNDAVAIQAQIDYQEANEGSNIRISGRCGTATRIDMPASANNGINENNTPMIIGSGNRANGIFALGTMVNLIRKTTPLSYGGGVLNLTLNGMGLTSGPTVSIVSGQNQVWENVTVLNMTGAGNSGWIDTSANDIKVVNLNIRMDPVFSGAVMPDYNLNADSEAGTYTNITAVNASVANIIVNGGGGKYNSLHTFNSGGTPRPTYGLEIQDGSTISTVDIDGAITAGILVSSRYVSVVGGNINCGNDSTMESTYAIEIESDTQDLTITGFNFDSDCGWDSANMVHQSGTPRESTQVFGNSGASYVRLNVPAFTQPQGRLSLSATKPVMAADVASGTTVYYLPYTGNRVPTFNALPAASTASFLSPYNFGAGMSLALDSNTGHTNDQASGAVYDIWKIRDNSNNHYLCTGTGWTVSAQASAVSITRTGGEDLVRDANSGLWVNAEAITDCRHGTASNDTKTVGVNMAVFLGSLYATANGVTTMTFAPAAASGGGNARLALYNAYNKVPFVAASLDSVGGYNYGTATWRPVNNSISNRVSWLDGLGDIFGRVNTQAFSTLSGAAVCRSGAVFNSITAAPNPYATDSVGGITVSVPAATVPLIGFNYAQAMEWADAADCTFDGQDSQSLSWSGAY